MGKPAKLRDIVVLGLLSEQPRYGYEIKMIIDHVMTHFLDVSSGSLYYGIKKLQQDGLIEETTIEKVGRRPERSVYRITAAGRQTLENQLPNYVYPIVTPFFPINLALYFFSAVPADQRTRRLKMWKERLKRSKQTMRGMIDSFNNHAAPSHLVILRHQIKYLDLELRFIDDLLASDMELPPYELTAADRAQVEAEYASITENFDYEIYHQSTDDELPGDDD